MSSGDIVNSVWEFGDILVEVEFTYELRQIWTFEQVPEFIWLGFWKHYVYVFVSGNRCSPEAARQSVFRFEVTKTVIN